MDSQQRDVSDSPHSSEEVESHPGTPATKLSTFSPEDVRTEQKISVSTAKDSNLPPAFFLHSGPTRSSSKGRMQPSLFGDPDPFTTASKASFHDTPKLSPSASAFMPLSLRKNAADTNGQALLARSSPNLDISGISPNEGFHTAPLQQASQSELKRLLHSVAESTLVSPTSQSPTWSPESSTTRNGHATDFGQFSSGSNVSRYLMISDIARNTSIEEFEAFFDPKQFSSLRHVVISELPSNGTIYISFADIRDTGKAYAKVQLSHQDWNVQKILATHIRTQGQLKGLIYPGSAYDGQVIVKTGCDKQGSFHVRDIGSLIKDLLANYGDIMAYSTMWSNTADVTCRAEFFNTIAADNALAHLNGFKLAGCVLKISRYEPRSDGGSQQLLRDHGPLIIGHENLSLDSSFRSLDLNGRHTSYDPETSKAAFASPYNSSSPASRSLSYRRDTLGQQLPLALDDSRFNGYAARTAASSPQWSPVYSPYADYVVQSPHWAIYNPGLFSPGSYSPSVFLPNGCTPGAIGQERVTPHAPQHRQSFYHQQQKGIAKPGSRQNLDYPSGHHNIVDVDRIRQGTDVRTTIMLRNIPNKIDQAMLKEIVDETSLAKYDFMYLRIDFANNCNVGYAFINFEDPYFIIDFVTARAGHRWNRYNSDKVAEVSYATIQGRDCLVQKFRNSSVMLEHPSFRPKIFHTDNGPMAGAEDKFPGPDNPSKMRRSVENAEHVGLFAPRAGQNFRDEQRRRRSQYDRGTRLAEIEDAYYFDHPDLDYNVDANHNYLGGQCSIRVPGTSHTGFEVY